MKSLPLFLTVTSVSLLCAIAQDKSGQLPGMSYEIAVKPAAELDVVAPDGEKVAFLDQSWVKDNPEVSQVQNHHTGWLKLAPGELSWPLKIRGKIFIPTDASILAKEVQVKVTARRDGRWHRLAEESIRPEGVGEWYDFEYELIRRDEDPVKGDHILTLSAAPFAGPVYLDQVHVTDAAGNELWEFPSFE